VTTGEPGRHSTLQGRDIICVGFADWDTELWTNQQHLMSRLARTNRVLFVESLGLRRPTLVAHDLRRIARRVWRGLRAPREVDGLHVLSPVVLPFHGSRLARALNARILPLLVRRAMRRLGLAGDVLWSYVPQAEMLLNAVRPRVVVYHCVDDIAAQKGVDAADFRATEERFARRADLVLASSPPLARRMGELSSNVVYAPNVADHALFATALDPGPVDPALQELPHPRLVFTGAVVATKLDLNLLVELARLRPGWSIALVGPVGSGDPRTDVSPLRAMPNIHLLGLRSHHGLPSVLRGADIGLIPYAINELTAGIFPMKVYEYLAAGLPVIATPLPSLAGVEGVAVAADAPATAARAEAELSHDGDDVRRKRSVAAGRHSWDARLAEISRAVAEVEAAG
jgi:glycosyltransferase involved in cell wall biosynthesis